jgi:predicted RecB family nuclease
MYLPVSVIDDHYRPSKCALRTYLIAKGEPEEPPTPDEQVVERLELEHEARYFELVPDYLDLSTGLIENRVARTLEALTEKVPVLFHPMLVGDVELGGQRFTIVGEPDFIMWQGDGHVVTECKLARRITDDEHPEILRQIELYGWLYEQMMSRRPRGLQVFSGTNALVDVAYQGGDRALSVLEEIVAIRSAASEPPAPIGHSWCGPCCFHEKCWNAAERKRDVGLVPGMDRDLALQLYRVGVHSYDELAAASATAGVSARILRGAEALATHSEIVLQPPAIPSAPCYVMLELEGLPRQLDDLDKVYLWGMQARGGKPGPYTGVTAGLGDEGDREGWVAFLAAARDIFVEHGDVPFVHWASHEHAKLARYVERYGDPEGTAGRVQANLLDLLAVTQSSIVLPLESYSLEQVGKYVGFKRTLPESDGRWSMAAFIAAVETHDEQHRQALLDRIRRYNREDLDALWAVQKWLQDHSIPD